MESQTLNTQTMLQLMSVVNQIHRTAVPMEDFAPGMSVPQLATISYMAFQNGKDVYQRDLELAFQLRRSTVSSMLSTMEKKGLIYRESVSHDGRLKKILLTEKGREMEETVLTGFSELNEIMTQGLSGEEIASLSSILMKIKNNLAEAERNRRSCE